MKKRILKEKVAFFRDELEIFIFLYTLLRTFRNIYMKFAVPREDTWTSTDIYTRSICVKYRRSSQMEILIASPSLVG